MTLRVNDVSDASGTFSGVPFNGTAAVVLGEGFAGKLDNVRIIPAALSVITPVTQTITYTYNARNQLETETTGSKTKGY